MSVDGEVLAELTRAVWASFVDAGLPLVDLGPGPLTDADHGAVVGSVSIDGPQARRLVVVMTAAAASDAAARMLDVDPGTVVTADVHDATGEIANMIGGNVKSMLAGGHRLGLPSVAAGSLPVQPPAEAVASTTLLWGEHTLLVSLDRAPGGTS